MTVTQRIIRQRLHQAGIKAHEKQVEGTTNLYNVIDDQLADVPPLTLVPVEPAYIQPTRPKDD